MRASLKPSWRGFWAHTPLTIVGPILKGTIDQTSSNGRSITLSSAFVRYEFSEPMRRRVIEKIVSLLDHPNPRVATEAGRHVHDAVAMPYGMGSAVPQGKLRGKYEKEFAHTIERITAKMEQMSPQTLLTVASSICWHADYGKGKPGKAAKKFLEALPGDIEFRLIAAMFDRWQFSYLVYRVVELVASMFDFDDENVVSFLDRKIDRANPIELKWIAKLVRHTHHSFVFKQRRFVERLLDRCAEVDRDALDMAIDLLSGGAMSGIRGAGKHWRVI